MTALPLFHYRRHSLHLRQSLKKYISPLVCVTGCPHCTNGGLPYRNDIGRQYLLAGRLFSHYTELLLFPHNHHLVNSMRLYTHLLACLPLLLFTAVGWSQLAEKDFVRYTVRDGLADNQIGCIAQDEHGYIWAGTDAGLNRFDGNSFTTFYTGTPPLHLVSGGIAKIKPFGQHELGIVTRSGFQIFNTTTNTVRHFIIPDTTALSAQVNASWDAHPLPNGNYAVSSAAGFYVFDSTGQVIVRHDAFNVADIGQKRILYARNIFPIDEKNLFVYINESGLAHFDIPGLTFSEKPPPHPAWPVFALPATDSIERWVVKNQMTPEEFVFIPSESDEIVYYNKQLDRKVITPVPFDLRTIISWETKVRQLNDTTYLLNDRSNGFYLLRKDDTGRIEFASEKLLSDYKIIDFFIDRDQRLWIATTEGLLKQILQPAFIQSHYYPPQPGDKFSGGFSCMYRHGDTLYAGRYSTHMGMAIIDARNMKLIKEVNFFEGKNNWNELRTIQMYHHDTLWIGANIGVMWYDTKTGNYGQLADDPNYAWAENFYGILGPINSHGDAWMCSVLAGKVVRFNVATQKSTVYTAASEPPLPFDRVKSITYDAYGDIWVGGHSLARFNMRSETFDTLITVYGGQYKFNDNILLLAADDEGSLWMHNSYNGLLEYRIREKEFVSYTTKDGLPAEIFNSLSEGRQHSLWIADNNHLTLFNTKDHTATVYDIHDGWSEQRPSSRMIYYHEPSALYYVGCTDYISVFQQKSATAADQSSALILESVNVDEHKSYFQPGNFLQLDYRDQTVRLQYTVIDFEKSNYQLAYRLNESDQWTSIGDQRTITLSHLAPGDYILEVKATGYPGIEKTHTLNFTITAPFWLTPWFLLLAILAATAIIYCIIHRRIQFIRQRANLDKLLVQSEMKALQAQMNPHFVFNSLNSIGEMILNNENQDASRYLSKFARLIRMTLDQSAHPMVSLRNTIDYLERYMEMENIRNHLFTHEITTDPQLDLDEIVVPPMLIQPFIENALWHGLTAARRDIHVRISFQKQGDNLVCIIDDNGIGIQQAQQQKQDLNGRHKSMGIANIKNRVALLNEKYNLHGDIHVVDKKELNGEAGSGTRVTLQLPLELRDE
jgi:ligand-binding sensor domain-containing protein/anti-sigma regulatory factor (Ser/Thr protein kinase)